jgi:hypothetical protein
MPVTGVVATTESAGVVVGAGAAGAVGVVEVAGAGRRVGAGRGLGAGAAPCTTISSNVAADWAKAPPGNISAPIAAAPSSSRFRERRLDMTLPTPTDAHPLERQSTLPYPNSNLEH